MAVSKHEDRMITLQQQVKENQLEIQEYLADLDSWTSDVTAKDRALVKHKVTEEPKLPPVRNSLNKKKRKKVKKKLVENGQGSEKTTRRISGYDYRAWDTFDIEKACDAVEKSSSEYETDDEWETERRRHLAEKEKENGNEHFKQGVYESAVESYTRGIHLDPTNAILPANRAMAYLKQHRYAEAVVDCTTAISLDPLYIKAYLRRASARLAQHYMEDAMADYDKVLTLEPHNKLAHCEKSRIQKEIANRKDQGLNVSSFVSSERGVVKPVYKAPEQRSKKPLRRLNIEEIGHVRDTGVKESAKKNQVKKLATCEDSHLLDPLISENTTCTQNPNSQLQGLQLQCSQGLQLQSSQLSHSQLPALQLTKSQLPINRFGSDSADCLKADNRPSSGTSVQVNSDMDRGVPQSSFQFQADYKVLKNKPEAFYKYFKQIEPSSLSTLFGHAIDADIILKIFTIFRDFFIPDGLDVLQYVHHLAQVNRFDMALMFLSPKEKQVLSDVFDHLRRHSSSNDKDLSALARRYQLSATR